MHTNNPGTGGMAEEPASLAGKRKLHFRWETLLWGKGD